MDNYDSQIRLEYNTEREKLIMPEYGRNVLKMVEYLKSIEDKEKRTEQALAVVKVMELLNPEVHNEDNWEQRLWDHLYMMSNYDLDVFSPYPMPDKESIDAKPMSIGYNTTPLKASHYGRNIENIINLIADLEESQMRDELIHDLALYMRQQYLIWNKDTVEDEMIFNDIERLSDYRLKIPEYISLQKLNPDQNFSRPVASLTKEQRKQRSMRRNFKKNNQKNR